MALPLWVTLLVTRGCSKGPDNKLGSSPPKQPACGHLAWALPGSGRSNQVQGDGGAHRQGPLLSHSSRGAIPRACDIHRLVR